MSPRSARGSGSLSEAAWQRQVEALARFYGWRLYHPPDNKPTHGGKRGGRQRVERGFPDLTLVRDAELIFAELKRDSTYPDADQRAWHDALRVVGDAVAQVAAATRLRFAGDEDGLPTLPVVDVYVWRPRDFYDVEARLARGRQVIPASFAPN